MHVLSDDSHLLRTVAPEGDTAPHAGAPPDGEAHALWRTLAGDRPAWSVERHDVDAPPGPWIVLREASVSHLDVLGALVAGGQSLPDGTTAVAMAGRFQGQRGRIWHAEPGNLQLVTHLHVGLPADTVQAALAALPAVAVADAITTLAGVEGLVGVKWVNDVVWRDAKVAGVLTRSDVTAGMVRSVRFGIGVNVARTPTLPPGDPAALPPAALADAHATFAITGAWAVLLPHVVERLATLRDLLQCEGADAIVDRYRAHATFLGRDVTIHPVDAPADAPPIVTGRVEALLPDLTLRIEGAPKPIATGRMRFQATQSSHHAKR